MNPWTRIKRVLFIGGSGHCYIAHELPPVGDADRPQVAVADDGHDRRAAEHLAKRLQADQWFDEPAAALDTFRPDLLNVGAVPGHNGTFNRLGLERNIATITEKPAAATWDDLTALATLARSATAPLVSEMPWRAMSPYLATRAAVDAGAIGDVVMVSAQKSYRFGARAPWYGSRIDSGGTIPWIASHAVDAVNFVTRRRWTRAWAVHGNVGRPEFAELEDHAVMIGTLERGGAISVTADYANPPASPAHADEWLRVAGTQGVIVIRGDRARLTDADVTERELPLSPMPTSGAALLSAVCDPQGSDYGTAHSITLAATLVALRDAADTGEAVDIQARLEQLNVWN